MKIEPGKKLNFWKSSQAFTLVETMMTVLIFSFVLASLYTVLAAGQSSWETNKTRIEMQQQVRNAMDWMINDLRQSGGSSIADVPANGTWYNQITFKTPSGVSGGSISWNASTIRFILGGTGGNQLQRIDASGTRVIAQNIQTIQFRRQSSSSNILEVNITAQEISVKGLTMQYPFNFKVQIRNT